MQPPGVVTEGYLGIVQDDAQKQIDEFMRDELFYPREKERPQRPSKDEYYLGIAKAVAQRSTCLRRRYGAVIVHKDEIISTGYNGSVRGMKNCCDLGYCMRNIKNLEHNTGDYSECESVHAEQNAMISANRQEMMGATIYLYGDEFTVDKEQSAKNEEEIYDFVPLKDVRPCPICKRMIMNSGIARIVTIGGAEDVSNRNTIL